MNANHTMTFAVSSLLSQMAQRNVSVIRQADSTFNAAGHSEDAGAATHKEKLWIHHVSMDRSFFNVLLNSIYCSCNTRRNISASQIITESFFSGNTTTNTHTFTSLMIYFNFMLFDKVEMISSFQWMEKCCYLGGCPAASVSLRVNERWNWGFIYHQLYHRKLNQFLRHRFFSLIFLAWFGARVAALF